MKQRYFTEGYISCEVIGEKENGELGLVAQRCKDCGRLAFPAYELCPYCSSANTERTFLSQDAAVLSASDTYAPVPPYKPPFTLAMVDIDNEVRTIVRVERGDGRLPEKGDKLSLRFGKLFEEEEFDRKTKNTETIEVIGYYYIPADSGDIRR